MSKSQKETQKNPVIRLVCAPGISDDDIKKLRKQIEKALKDPNYCVIANYRIEWNEIPITDKNATRIIWSDEINEKETDELRDQVEKALSDPDYVIITNYKVNWEEVKVNV